LSFCLLATRYSPALAPTPDGETAFDFIVQPLAPLTVTPGDALGMAEGIFIRKADLRDADAILGCLHLAFAPYRDSYSSEAFADSSLTDDSLRRRLVAMTVLVAIDQFGEVVGTVAYTVKANGDGHFRGMAVAPDAQGSGVARALLHRVEADLRELGCRAVTLDTTAPLQRAIRFYERNGFRAMEGVGSFFGMPLFTYRKDI
jgi:ribosomal protein S18 acetylase RimI-like enzyme